MNWLRPSLVGLLVALALSASPAAADADTFYAAQGAPMAGPCSQATPCHIEYAVETQAQNTDEVIVLPGNHIVELSSLTIDNQITVRGLSSAQRPSITIDPAPDTGGLVVDAGSINAQLRDLAITSLGSGIALNQVGDGVIAERLYVTQGDGLAACDLTEDAVLRDSVCFSTSAGGDAIRKALGGAVSFSYRLVNVTAVATGAGSTADAIHLDPAGGADPAINASNVIAMGGGGFDLKATTGASGDTAVIALDHSNYDSEDESGGGVENITNPGIGTNQTSAPLFESGAGNFHQADGSPTIDMGATNTLLGGTLDFDGEARAQGASQDIGADEFTVPPPSSSTPLPPTPTPGLADLVGANVKGKKLIVTLACAATGGCLGNEIALRTAKKLDPSRIAVAAKRKRLLLAKGTASLAAGETRTVRLKLRKQGRRLFGARGKVRATATIAAAGGSETEQLKIKRK